MNDFILGVLTLTLLFSGMLLSLYIGKRLAIWQKNKYPHEIIRNNKILEAAIFALMGLLIAFTFSGARERFDMRRTLVVDEANAIQTAYHRIDLLSIENRSKLQESLKQYIQLRFEIYEKMPHLDEAVNEIKQSDLLQQQIWHTAANECSQEKTSAACIVLLPALTTMFEIANTRIETTKIHPPVIIFITLIGLAMLSAALSGYSMRNKSIWRSLHALAYAVIISFTLFIIIDLEYPHLGFIHVNYFNNVLQDAARGM